MSGYETDELEQILIDSKFKILAKRPNKHGDVLLAERFADPTRHDGEMLVETIWFVRRDKARDGRSLFHELQHPQHIRMAAAEADAEKWIKDNLDIGRY